MNAIFMKIARKAHSRAFMKAILGGNGVLKRAIFALTKSPRVPRIEN
jgi:hypothetical protein